ncbi:MAG: non-homologous end-joining DNA ligase [Candidatus Dependentiae bacterium]|nr:non-homologous end-joining DNA ligase [Candidatus Dependentiae bacterium]
MNNNIFATTTAEDLKKRKKSTEPLFMPLMLATLTKTYFSDPNWLYEHKFDGERCLIIKKKGKVYLTSRNKKSMNDEYPELVDALLKEKADNFIIDGEIISTNKAGISDFQLLQGRINLKKGAEITERGKIIPIQYYVFDLLYVDGYDIRQLPLCARKSILKKLLSYNKIVRYTEHQVGNGISFFKKACSLKWEGLIAKRMDGPYIGRRSTDWLKFKCIMQQELVIGGYTLPKGSRDYFGALLVGYYKDGTLRYAGKVGTGYTEDVLAMLGSKLEKIKTAKCPFSNYDESTKNVIWVKPSIVAEFHFANWTKANKLRVGRYKGLRDDKRAKDVVKETPKAIGPHT